MRTTMTYINLRETEDSTSHYSLGLPCLFLLNQEDPLILTRRFFLPWMPWSSPLFLLSVNTFSRLLQTPRFKSRLQGSATDSQAQQQAPRFSSRLPGPAADSHLRFPHLLLFPHL